MGSKTTAKNSGSGNLNDAVLLNSREYRRAKARQEAKKKKKNGKVFKPREAIFNRCKAPRTEEESFEAMNKYIEENEDGKSNIRHRNKRT